MNNSAMTRTVTNQSGTINRYVWYGKEWGLYSRKYETLKIIVSG